MIRASWLAFVVVVAGCFGEAPETTSGDTGTPGCPVGSEGCDCTPGDGCDGELECLLPAGVCVQPGCTPGAALCSCDAGTCVDGHVCTQNLCAPEPEPGETSSNASTVDPTDDPSTPTDASSTGSSIETGDAEATTNEPSTTGPGPDTGVAESSSSGEMVTCHECQLAAQLGPCSDEYAACPLCTTQWTCVVGGESTPEECCTDNAPQAGGWATFAACVDMECTSVCDPISCGG